MSSVLHTKWQNYIWIKTKTTEEDFFCDKRMIIWSLKNCDNHDDHLNTWSQKWTVESPGGKNSANWLRSWLLNDFEIYSYVLNISILKCILTCWTYLFWNLFLRSEHSPPRVVRTEGFVHFVQLLLLKIQNDQILSDGEALFWIFTLWCFEKQLPFFRVTLYLVWLRSQSRSVGSKVFSFFFGLPRTEWIPFTLTLSSKYRKL